MMPTRRSTPDCSAASERPTSAFDARTSWRSAVARLAAHVRVRPWSRAAPGASVVASARTASSTGAGSLPVCQVASAPDTRDCATRCAPTWSSRWYTACRNPNSPSTMTSVNRIVIGTRARGDAPVSIGSPPETVMNFPHGRRYKRLSGLGR